MSVHSLKRNCKAKHGPQCSRPCGLVLGIGSPSSRNIIGSGMELLIWKKYLIITSLTSNLAGQGVINTYRE